MKIAANQENWDYVAEYAEQVLEKTSCPRKDRIHIVTAMEEIFVNISMYAYTGGDGDVVVSMETQKDGVMVTFEDRGVEYNPLEKTDPDITLSAGERKIGGLGIYMAKKLMDHVDYSYCDGKNILVMKKNWINA